MLCLMLTVAEDMTFGALTSSSSERHDICHDYHEQSKCGLVCIQALYRPVDVVRRQQDCAGGSAWLLCTFAHANCAHLSQVIARVPFKNHVVGASQFDQSYIIKG